MNGMMRVGNRISVGWDICGFDVSSGAEHVIPCNAISNIRLVAPPRYARGC
jgi:hypothetical protein